MEGDGSTATLLAGLGGTLLGVIGTGLFSLFSTRIRIAAENGRTRETLLFEHRRDAITAVVNAFGRYQRAEWDSENGIGGPPGEDGLDHLWNQLAMVRIYCAPATVTAAEGLHASLAAAEYGAATGQQPSASNDAFDTFVAAGRAELGVS